MEKAVALGESGGQKVEVKEKVVESDAKLPRPLSLLLEGILEQLEALRGVEWTWGGNFSSSRGVELYHCGPEEVETEVEVMKEVIWLSIFSLSMSGLEAKQWFIYHSTLPLTPSY